MKSFLVYILILIPGFLFAYPELNDSVTYNGKYHFQDKKVTIGFIQEFLVTEVDKAANKYKIQTTFYTPDGKDSVEIKEVDGNELKTKAQVQETLRECENVGGKLQKLTVIAGTYSTCYFMDEKKNEIWIADVPFFIAKQVEYDEKGNRIEVELALVHEANTQK